MPHNRGTRRKPNFVGVASYKGRRKWISGCESVAEYNEAVKQARAELREEVENPDAKRVPTCLEFAGAEIHEDGRITMIWPDGQHCQKKTGRRRTSVERLRDTLKPFVREFGERPIDSFGRDEALTWVLAKNANVQQSVRQFFNHAKDRELIRDNKFARTGASKSKRRVERPDFRKAPRVRADQREPAQRQGVPQTPTDLDQRRERRPDRPCARPRTLGNRGPIAAKTARAPARTPSPQRGGRL